MVIATEASVPPHPTDALQVALAKEWREISRLGLFPVID
jgi:hypothetical protein